MVMLRSLLLLLLLPLGLLAQKPDAVVYGTVTDQDGKPAANINIFVVNYGGVGLTREDGVYKAKVPSGPIRLVFSFQDAIRDTVSLNLAPGESFQQDVQLNLGLVLPDVNVTDTRNVVDDPLRTQASAISISTVDAHHIAYPSMDIVSLLVSQSGVYVPSELSNQYTVRGGNFDENLVYVNGYEIYRPFLIRSGQQEGLSFVNPDLVDNLTFSAGGFQAKYGDKMSSVLAATYKKPDSLAGSVSFGLLGGSAHLEGAIHNKLGYKKFTFVAGVRQKQNQYLLKGLETSGQYSPSFTDFQGFFTYTFSKHWSVEYITNFARNRFVFVPVDRETTFGVVNQVLRLTMYFEGGEEDRYQTYMNGFAIVNHPKKNLELRWMSSAYLAEEQETFDILAEYYIGEVESDLGNDNFGQVRYNLGVGGLQNYARNRLVTTVVNAEHQGKWSRKADSSWNSHELEWGLRYQREIIEDRIREWEELDSAGHSLPYNTDQVLLSYVLRSDFNLSSNRYTGYFQDTWQFGYKRFTLNYGVRFTYWSVNKEFIASPRVQFSYRPQNVEKNIVFNLAFGMYTQPPFYREMRNLQGEVNTNLKAQKSLHAIAGIDYNFKLWNRNFKFISEIYYKYLYDLVPYEFDNVLIRYYGQNKAIGYTAGVDLRLNGEFVKGTDSYISLSILKTAEDIIDDTWTAYYDSTGTQVPEGDPTAVTTKSGTPGRIPRPTDQRVVFNMFFQDYLPKHENFKMHLNLIFASGLPFGPPDNIRYKDTLRIPPYRRVDIGFSALLFDKKTRQAKFDRQDNGKTVGKFMQHLESIWVTFEVYNLLGINNTISYLWIKDLNNNNYAVPNYLTNRRFNLRAVVRF